MSEELLAAGQNERSSQEPGSQEPGRARSQGRSRARSQEPELGQLG